MSTGDDLRQHHDNNERQPSVVADVSFKPISHDADRPASSRGDSFKHEKEKWNLRGERLKDRFLTPPRSLSSRKSEDGQKDEETMHGSIRKRLAKSKVTTRDTDSLSKGKQAAHDINYVESVRASSSRAPSDGSSLRSGDSPAIYSFQGRESRLSKSPSMDPAQLVQMALNLSESRKRHVSNPVAAAAAAASALAGNARPVSASNPVLESQQNAVNTKTVDAHESTATAQELYDFSPATLARAEKARRYFELADKHRRLLHHLPPLPRTQTRSRAFSRSSHRNSVLPDDSNAVRMYNPLQALRNRQLRQQQNEDISDLIEQCQDVELIEDWLSQIEAKKGDILPKLSNADRLERTSKGHRRGGTAETIITRPSNEWTIGPAELLADTYLTQKDNLISNEDHAKQLPQISTPTRAQQTSDHDEDMHGRSRHRLFLPISAANRIRSSRFTRLNRSASISSASSTEGQKVLPYAVGPLQRHMNEMIEKDAQEASNPPSTQSPDHWETRQHRNRLTRSPRHVQENGHVQAPLQEHVLRKRPVTPSPDTSQPTSPAYELPTFTTTEADAARRRSIGLNNVRNKIPLLGSRSKERDGVNTFDFVQPPEHQKHEIDASRLSAEATRPATFRRHKTADSVSSSIRDLIHTRSKTESSEGKEPESAVSRFLRGGRLGDIVRTESSRFGNKLRGRDRRGDESDISAMNSDASDIEAEPAKLITSAETSDASPRTSLEKTRNKMRYHLPSFRSPQQRDTPALPTINADGRHDHITQQQADLRIRNRSPRFERLAPPRINLPDDDVDVDATLDKSLSADDRRRSYGFLNPALRMRSRSHSKSRPFLGRGRSTVAATTLSPPVVHKSDEERDWSITNKQPIGVFSSKEHGINSRDIARVRTLLLASGIKAREISRRLTMPSVELPGFLLESARICDATSSLERKSQREEYAYAVQMLSSFIDQTLSSLNSRIERFQSKDLQELITKQDKSKARVSDELTELVHNASDQADAFNMELSTQATLRTKQVDDAIDSVLRLRRRQFRLLRKAAFKLLEWFTLSLLWWVWFVVICFKTVQRTIFEILRFLRWLLIF